MAALPLVNMDHQTPEEGVSRIVAQSSKTGNNFLIRKGVSIGPVSHEQYTAALEQLGRTTCMNELRDAIMNAKCTTCQHEEKTALLPNGAVDIDREVFKLMGYPRRINVSLKESGTDHVEVSHRLYEALFGKGLYITNEDGERFRLVSHRLEQEGDIQTLHLEYLLQEISQHGDRMLR
jgi:hypothetical protein